MNHDSLNFADPDATEGARADLCCDGVEAASAKEDEFEPFDLDLELRDDGDCAGEWPIHANFDADVMAAILLETADQTPQRRTDRKSSSSMLPILSSIAFHLGVGALCFALTARYVFTSPRFSDQRFGDATSEGGVVDAASNGDRGDLPQSQTQPPDPSALPADRLIDANNAKDLVPIDAFAQAATDRSVADNIDSDEPPPMIGPPADSLSAPAFPKRKTANLTASYAVAAPAHQAGVDQSSAGPAPAAAPHAQRAGQLRIRRGTPGGRRDGFDLDARGIPIPPYPAESKRRGEEGLVKLDVEIFPDGSIGRVAIIDDAGYPRLAAAAVRSARAALFEPESYDQPRHQMVPYRFTLR